MAHLRKDRQKNNSIYHFFLISYISILLLALSSSLVYGLKIQSQTMRENSLSHEVLLSSLRSDLETNLLYVQERCNSLAFNSTIQLYVSHPDLYDRTEVMHELATDGAMADFLRLRHSPILTQRPSRALRTTASQSVISRRPSSNVANRPRLVSPRSMAA